MTPVKILNKWQFRKNFQWLPQLLFNTDPGIEEDLLFLYLTTDEFHFELAFCTHFYWSGISPQTKSAMAPGGAGACATS